MTAAAPSTAEANGATGDGPRPSGVGRSAALMTVATAASQIGQIGLLMVVSYQLSKTDYGTFRQLYILDRSLQTLAAFGIPVSLQYFLPRLIGNAKRSLVARSVVALLLSGCVVAAALFLLADRIGAWFDNPQLPDLLRLFCFYPLATLPTQALRAVLLDLRRVTRLAAFLLADSIVLLAVAAGSVVLTGDLGLLIKLMVAYGGVKLLAVGVMLALALPRVGHAEGRVGLAEQARFSAIFSGSTFIEAINPILDKFLAALFFSVEQFAKYANGAFHVPLVSVVVSSFTAVLLPEYVRLHDAGNTRGMIALWHRSIRQTAVLFLPLVSFLVLFANPFVSLMFSAKYGDADTIFRIYAVALIPQMTWYSYVLLAMGHKAEPAIASAVNFTVNLGLSLAFICLFGLVGPAVGTVATSFLMVGWFLTRIRARTGMTYAQLFPWTPLLRIAAVAVVALLPAVPIAVYGDATLARFPVIGGSDILRFGATLAGGGVVYALTLLLIVRASTVVADEDLALFRRFLGRRNATRGPADPPAGDLP